MAACFLVTFILIWSHQSFLLHEIVAFIILTVFVGHLLTLGRLFS